jgi:hypothetical protein
MFRFLLSATLLAALVAPAIGGMTNPWISILGQPFMSWTDDPSDPDRLHLRLDPGETELVFDDYLNPYARGLFILTLGEEGLELEEGFFTLFRGLPFNVAVKGGQYRTPFGRLNLVHPHLNPFAEPFGILGAYLPGEEAFIEPGIDVSRRFPVAGDFSLNAQADWFQGNTFRLERESSGDPSDPLETGGDDDAELTRAAALGRVSGFTMLGERSALEFGVSASQGTNNVAAKARTTLLGVDAKVKLWTSSQAYVLLQGEAIRMNRDMAEWDPADGYTLSTVRPAGAYVFADYNFGIRYNVGGGYERFQETTADKPVTQTVNLWAGYALMEETTSIRLDWRHTIPDEGDSVNAVTLRVIYSMGPHKAHQF